jgi:hypothetical protein
MGAGEQLSLEQQVQTATSAFREVAACLLRAGAVRPEAIVMGAVQVTGELGASMALASGESLEALLGELGKVMQQAGREHRRTLEMAMLPAAGRA